jgi:transaldolase
LTRQEKGVKLKPGQQPGFWLRRRTHEREGLMNGTRQLSAQGQSIWIDNITRDMLESGTLKRYIDEMCVTGLTSNPTIFNQAISSSSSYDAAICRETAKGRSGEALFFDLALSDITRAADLFRLIYDRTDTEDGWVSLEVSPLLAYEPAATLAAAKDLFARARRPNILIKIPGTKEGLPAVEEAIFSGVPVNVTLLFSREQYLAAASAYLRGIERRIEAGLDPNIGSVASVFVSRWDTAVAASVPGTMKNRLGIAMAKRVYAASCSLFNSARWQRICKAGARSQRLLWASTGTKDPAASDILYVETLAAPSTVNTMPETTLKALAGYERLGKGLTSDAGDGEEVLKRFTEQGVDIDSLAAQLQEAGAKAFVKSWNDLMAVIGKRTSLSGVIGTGSKLIDK